MVAVDEERILRDNRRISIQMEQWGNLTLCPWGLTAAQGQVLMYVLRHSDRGTSLTEIHREFGYSMAALSSILKRLREKGYIRVEHCSGDKRRKLLFATKSALALRQHLVQSTCQIRQRLRHCFTQQELSDLDRLQQKLLQNLSELTRQAKEERML